VFRNSKCVDCGVESDARLLPLVCHVLKEQVHSSPQQPFHPLSAVLKHAVPVPRLVHVGTMETSEHKIKGNNKDGIKQVAAGAVTGLVTNSVAPVIGALPALIPKGSVTTKVVSYWSCCGKAPDADGCQSQFPCCGQPVSNPGCQDVYQCCSSCRYFIFDHLCNAFILIVSEGNPGCARRYPCCGGEEASAGCREQCSYCKVVWGQFDSNVGCIGRNHNHVIRLE